MQVKFKKDSWHAKWWALTNNERSKLPSNLCSYFWNIVISILGFPLTWMTYLMPEKWKLCSRLGVGFFINLVTVVPIWVFTDEFMSDGHGFWTAFAFALMTLVFMYMAIFIVAYVCMFLESLKYKDRPSSLLPAFIKAKKDKVCPMIDWEEK